MFLAPARPGYGLVLLLQVLIAERSSFPGMDAQSARFDDLRGGDFLGRNVSAESCAGDPQLLSGWISGEEDHLVRAYRQGWGCQEFFLAILLG